MMLPMMELSRLVAGIAIAVVFTTTVRAQGLNRQQYQQQQQQQHSGGGGGGGKYGGQQQQQQQQHTQQHRRRKPEILTKEEIGDRTRFWNHIVTEESLVHKGVDYYQTIKSCIFDDVLSPTDGALISTANRDGVRAAGKVIRDPFAEQLPILIIVEQAMHPVHVKGVQALATCVRKYMPHLYESRAMYMELDLDEDDGSGGNCPTHLAPLVNVFLPQVVVEMEKTLQFAYDHVSSIARSADHQQPQPGASWQALVEADQRNEYKPREKKMYPPQEVGIRASEHLTYNDFKEGLAEHHDGDTCYTMNFAFSDYQDYDGGEFFILSRDDEQYEPHFDRHGNVDNTHNVYEFRDTVKPNKYEALVFLGGRYMHGVTEITGGYREMFSTELWAFPDTPFGSNLWSNYPHNMETYVKRCNQQQQQTGSSKCTLPYDLGTPYHDSVEEAKNSYNDDEDEDEFEEFEDEFDGDGDSEFFEDDYGPDEEMPVWVDDGEVDGHGDKLAPPLPGINRAKDNRNRPNRIKPNRLKPSRVIFNDGNGHEYELDDYYNVTEEPDFLLPKQLEVGEMRPILWRDDLSPVDGPDGESFVIGFPPELHQEFAKYVANSGMMKIAHSLLYKEEPLEMGEQRIYTLDDGEKWTAMVQGSWDTDMVWLDPGDESCFESLLGILRRGNFEKVLDQVGKAFDLDGVMISGVGAIFLSEYDQTRNMHVDIEGSRGSFYNVIVPVHIPADDVAIFKLTDKDDDFQGQMKLDPNVGVVLGGESRHGTGECNYRPKEEFRLSFAVYFADINESNIELIADDSTSLWPTSGDTFFFRAQKGRLWTKDGTNSITYDKGRQPMNIQDKFPEKCSKMDKSLCETDLQGMRLRCPKTCELYLEDDVYYNKYFPTSEFRRIVTPNKNPTCNKDDKNNNTADNNNPSCVDTNEEEKDGHATTATATTTTTTTTTLTA